MILILSVDYDISTNRVIDWLIASKKDFVRINDCDTVRIKSFYLQGTKNNIEIEVNTKHGLSYIIDLNSITSYWYRRGDFALENNKVSFDPSFEFPEFYLELNRYLENEGLNVIDFIHWYLSTIKSINSFQYKDVNKLQAIFEANRLGLSTPETAIVSTRAELAAFLEKHDRVITKGILRNSFGKFLKFNIGCLTKLVTQTELKNVTETFGLSLIQQYIEKYCELRIFYLDGIFYPCAIFSQSDENTKIDFRQYDSANPIRIVRFTLPEGIQSALILLMQRLNLSSGSIDMILTSQNEYYFLEVNPIGQFGFISHKCLYNLESKIAEYLT